MLSVLVCGAGAVGALYGALLANAGCSVSVLCRSNAQEISRHGISINSHQFGTWLFTPARVYTRGDALPACDVVIVATKTTVDCSVDIRSAVGKSTRIIIIQNGIDVETVYAKAFPTAMIGSGLAFVCSNRLTPTSIHHIDYGRLVLGRYPHGQDSMIHDLVDRLAQINLPAKYCETIRSERWKKLMWNVAFNPLSAILRQTTDQLLAVPEIEMLCRHLMTEVIAIAQADGCELSPDAIDRTISDTMVMTPYKTSMLLDVEANRPIERVAILGNAIAIADAHDVSVPHMKTLNAILKGVI